jgi:hypothetical protein
VHHIGASFTDAQRTGTGVMRGWCNHQLSTDVRAPIDLFCAEWAIPPTGWDRRQIGGFARAYAMKSCHTK